ncbi:MAG: methyl-accepting chemotaxis protein [Pseudomonadales bacterium]|nr:methyl-accepting chemotaxis protein [Pseudomonadales bacterium]
MNTKRDKKMAKLSKPRTRILMTLFVVALALLVINLVFVNIHSGEDQIYIQRTADLRVLSQEIPQRAAEAIAGSDEAFDQLSRARSDFDAAWNLIIDGRKAYVDSGIGLKTNLPGRGNIITLRQPDAQNLWTRISGNAELVLANREGIESLNAIITTAAANIPQMQRSYDEVVNTLLDNNESLATIAVAQRQTWLSERIALNLNRIAAGDEQAQAAVEQLQRDISLFSSNHEALLEGDVSIGINRVADSVARAALDNISELFSALEARSIDIIAAAPQIFKATQAVDAIVRDAELLQVDVTELYQFFTETRGQHLASPVLAYGLLLGILFLMVLYGIEVIRQSRLAERMAGTENQKKNNAVMNLLEEISDLAEGDLSVEATVSEDFTGAIADSINYAVGQLRELVSAIIEVSVQVSESTRSSERTARHLSDASERQTSNISSVSESIREMEQNINRVSANAIRSLDVARNSVDIASGGAEVVKNTIQGMDIIRGQIQETAKRIKRLGESSQEIGGFVSLINDIADHTNTLSLNAAIQAAMAGEAGKGFGVVADEVHALAERSRDATRQIESLVKVIQRDITEAVSSMEQTTTEVVQGTHLAQGAGSALDDIEKVSRELAALVEEITDAAQSQSRTASEITGSMEIIQQITTETSSGTKATSEFIFNLGKLTDRLHNAVAGFSLSPKNSESALPAQDGAAAGSTDDEDRMAADVDVVVAYPQQDKERNFKVRGMATA